MRPYLQHGRRHSPTGSDPIPGLGGSQIAFASLWGTSSPVITSGSQQGLDLEDGVSAVFETSDSSIFSNGSIDIGFGTQHGIEISQPGSYMAMGDYVVDGGTAGVYAQVINYIYGATSVSNFLFGRTAVTMPDEWDADLENHISFIQNFDLTSGGPVFVLPIVDIASGASVSIQPQMFVWCLGSYAGGDI
jgi:hypothetical protein